MNISRACAHPRDVAAKREVGQKGSRRKKENRIICPDIRSVEYLTSRPDAQDIRQVHRVAARRGASLIRSAAHWRSNSPVFSLSLFLPSPCPPSLFLTHSSFLPPFSSRYVSSHSPLANPLFPSYALCRCLARSPPGGERGCCVRSERGEMGLADGGPRCIHPWRSPPAGNFFFLSFGTPSLFLVADSRHESRKERTCSPGGSPAPGIPLILPSGLTSPDDRTRMRAAGRGQRASEYSWPVRARIHGKSHGKFRER